MRRHLVRMILFGAVTAAIAAVPLAAQNSQDRSGPELNVAVTYNASISDVTTGSNFWLQGGSAQIHGRFYGGLGVVADVAGMHIANINSTGVGLDMVTATFGPRYTWSTVHSRSELFVQGLAGVANGFNSVFPNRAGAQTVGNSLAVLAGGGLNVKLRPHLVLRAFEADYLRTQLPNSTNNVQNNLRVGAGIVLRLR